MTNNVTLGRVIRICVLLSLVFAFVLGLSITTGSVRIDLWRLINGINLWQGKL